MRDDKTIVLDNIVKTIKDFHDKREEPFTTADIAFVKHMINGYLLYHKKNLDYGRDNIRRSGMGGLITRMDDKICRLRNLYEKGVSKAKNESFVDSLVDAANYAIIGLILDEGKWE